MQEVSEDFLKRVILSQPPAEQGQQGATSAAASFGPAGQQPDNAKRHSQAGGDSILTPIAAVCEGSLGLQALLLPLAFPFSPPTLRLHMQCMDALGAGGVQVIHP